MQLINPSNFLLGEIPRLNPYLPEYAAFWAEQATLCRNGYWVMGQWMPGNLYFYCNFYHIELLKKPTDKDKSKGLPRLRDLEWEFAYYYAEARGFSGFSGMAPEDYFELGRKLTPREILRKNWGKPMGTPLYLNQAKNLMYMGSRGLGKSYHISGMGIAYEFTFKDGNNIIVGASDSKYSTPLMKKVEYGLTHLPGAITMGDDYFAAPFQKSYVGVWDKINPIAIQAREKLKVGNSWVDGGSMTTIAHLTFQQSAHAANGQRTLLMILDEVGLFHNFMATHNANKALMRDGQIKFGTAIYTGTGGDMKGGGTKDAQKMFENPDDYDLLAIEDPYENMGRTAYFVPYTKAICKDELGNTNMEEAEKLVADERAAAKASSDPDAYDELLQNYPTKPSEMFLLANDNPFPKQDLIAHKRYLLSKGGANHLGQTGTIGYDPKGNPFWRGNPDLKALNFPHTSGADPEGAIVIFEHPEFPGRVIPGLYCAGGDPYDHDKSTTKSFGSTFIFKRFIGRNDEIYDWPVAEYTGRPKSSPEHHDKVLSLLRYFGISNAFNHENNCNTIYYHFDNKGELWRMADAPQIFKSSEAQGDRLKGTNVHPGNKDAIIMVGAEWLNREYAPGKKNLTKILSIPLLDELISYNKKGNFDRVIAFCLTIIQDMSMVKQKYQQMTNRVQEDDFFSTSRQAAMFRNDPFHSPVSAFQPMDLEEASDTITADDFFTGSSSGYEDRFFDQHF